LALPGRLREITSPLWPVLDVILDVTRYLDRDRRTRILARAHSVFEGVLAQKYDRVVIVSHSQGTLIAADLLRMTRDSRMERKTPTVDLVTMGSPLANLYHRLLPGSFAWVERAVANRSELGVGSWANFYGGGDAVGRTVRDTELLQRLRAAARESEDDITWVEETNVGSIGHVSYFDPEVGPAETIRTLLRAAVIGGART